MMEHGSQRKRMASNYFRNVTALVVGSLIAMSQAVPQVPTVPAARFHHSGVYDEARKEFLIYGGYTWDRGTNEFGAGRRWHGSTSQLGRATRVRKEAARLCLASKHEIY